MRPVLLCAILAGFCLPQGQAADGVYFTQPVTVLLDFEQKHADELLPTMRRELQSIMNGAGVTVDVQLKNTTAEHTQFSRLVLFKMKGACTMNALPVGALSDERGPLAMTYASDGQLLPFGEVECDRVRESLQRTLGRGDPRAKQAAYGTALARVVAHEMYHMIADSKSHTKAGVTKESLSSRELLRPRLPFSERAATAMQEASQRTVLR